MAYRLGSKAQGTEGMVSVGLLTLQTAALFLEVSLAAAEVQEVVSCLYLPNGFKFSNVPSS